GSRPGPAGTMAAGSIT
nr:18 kda basic fibroblast growth factor homolog {N-terminal} [human, amniotic tumor wish cells, Peptide Partial, 16 aa] [Homo sapiens]